jgi:hypothetical protein
MWMSALFPAATLTYGVALASGNPFTARVGTALTWAGAAAGLIGLLVRWHETHLYAGGIGYIPVSNLYEVFVLFAVITALIYLYYEAAQNTRSMGFFVLLIISASIGFLLWYHFEREAYQIEMTAPGRRACLRSSKLTKSAIAPSPWGLRFLLSRRFWARCGPLRLGGAIGRGIRKRAGR